MLNVFKVNPGRLEVFLSSQAQPACWTVQFFDGKSDLDQLPTFIRVVLVVRQ